MALQQAKQKYSPHGESQGSPWPHRVQTAQVSQIHGRPFSVQSLNFIIPTKGLWTCTHLTQQAGFWLATLAQSTDGSGLLNPSQLGPRMWARAREAAGLSEAGRLLSCLGWSLASTLTSQDISGKLTFMHGSFFIFK